MLMMAQLSQMVSVAQEKEQLTILLKEKQLQVKMISEKEEWFLLFTDGTVKINSSANEEATSVTITGKESEIELVMTGQVKLREAERRDKIHLTASFRNALFLESFFYLTKKSV